MKTTPEDDRRCWSTNWIKLRSNLLLLRPLQRLNIFRCPIQSAGFSILAPPCPCRVIGPLLEIKRAFFLVWALEHSQLLVSCVDLSACMKRVWWDTLLRWPSSVSFRSCQYYSLKEPTPKSHAAHKPQPVNNKLCCRFCEVRRKQLRSTSFNQEPQLRVQ